MQPPTVGPTAIEELWWGKRLRGCRVVLRRADRTLVRQLLTESWRHKAPKGPRAIVGD